MAHLSYGSCPAKQSPDLKELQDFKWVDMNRCCSFVMPDLIPAKDGIFDRHPVEDSGQAALDSGSVIPDLIRDRNDDQHLGVCRPSDTVSLVAITKVECKISQIPQFLTH